MPSPDRPATEHPDPPPLNASTAALRRCVCPRCGQTDPTTYTTGRPPGTAITFLLTCDHAYVWTIGASR